MYMYMNVLYMKGIPYNWRFSFSSLQLHARYDWWATAPNIHHCPLPICHYVCISSIHVTQKPQCACNGATHQTTPLLSSMLCLILQVAKQLKPSSYSPIQTLLCCYLCAIKIDIITLGTYDFTTHQTTSLLQELIFVCAYQGMTYELSSRWIFYNCGVLAKYMYMYYRTFK